MWKIIACVLLVLLVNDSARSEGHECPNEGMDNPISFYQLREDGCLPDDFEMPEDGQKIMSDCWRSSRQERSAHGAHKNKLKRMQKALSCMAMRMELIEDGEFQMETLVGYIDEWSDNSTWKQSQRDNMQMCQLMMEDGLSAHHQAVFMLVCSRGLGELQCRRHSALELGGDAAVTILNVDAGKCLDKVKPNRVTKMAWEACVAREFREPSSVEDLIEMMSEYDIELDEEQRSQVQMFVDKLHRTLACTMRGSAQATGDVVNFDVIKDMTTTSQGPAYAKTMRLAVVEECQNLGADSIKELLECWWQMAPVACVAGKAYMLLGMHMPEKSGPPMMPQQPRQQRPRPAPQRPQQWPPRPHSARYHQHYFHHH